MGGGHLDKKAFTLIELLAVIVILAIIALIATPIILGIINEAREESKERSKENYLIAAKQAVVAYQMNNPDIVINGVCMVERTGLNCEGINGIIKVEIDGENLLIGKSLRFIDGVYEGEVESVPFAGEYKSLANSDEIEFDPTGSIKFNGNVIGSSTINEDNTKLTATFTDSPFPGVETMAFEYFEVKTDNGINKVFYNKEASVFFSTLGNDGIIPEEFLEKTYKSGDYKITFNLNFKGIRLITLHACEVNTVGKCDDDGDNIVGIFLKNNNDNLICISSESRIHIDYNTERDEITINDETYILEN